MNAEFGDGTWDMQVDDTEFRWSPVLRRQDQNGKVKTAFVRHRLKAHRQANWVTR